MTTETPNIINAEQQQIVIQNLLQQLRETADTSQRLAEQLEFAGVAVSKQLIATEKMLINIQRQIAVPQQVSVNLLQNAVEAQYVAQQQQIIARQLGVKIQATSQLLQEHMLHCALLTQTSFRLSQS